MFSEPLATCRSDCHNHDVSRNGECEPQRGVDREDFAIRTNRRARTRRPLEATLSRRMRLKDTKLIDQQSTKCRIGMSKASKCPVSRQPPTEVIATTTTLVETVSANHNEAWTERTSQSRQIEEPKQGDRWSNTEPTDAIKRHQIN